MRRVGLLVLVAFAALVSPASSGAQGDVTACLPADWLANGVVLADGVRPCTGPDDPGARGLCRTADMPQPAGWGDVPVCSFTEPDGSVSGGFVCRPPDPSIQAVEISILDNGAWRDASKDLCLETPQGMQSITSPAGGGGQQYENTSLYNLTDGSFDLTPVLPEGSRISLRIVFAAGAVPSSAFIVGRHAKVAFDGQAITVEADTARQLLGTEGSGGNCPTAHLFRSVFEVSVNFAGAPDGMGVPAGMWFASNGTEMSTPIPSFGSATGPMGMPLPDGIGMDVTGCGDGDPTTDDGFYEAFVPSSVVRGWGLGPNLLGDVPDDAAAAVVTLSDNAGPSDADLQVSNPSDTLPAPVQGRPLIKPPTTAGPSGVSIDYSMSFSSHHLTIKPRRAGIRVVKACKKAKGRLRGRGRKLRCVRRRR